MITLAKAFITRFCTLLFFVLSAFSLGPEPSHHHATVYDIFRTEDGSSPLGSIYGGTMVTLIGQGFDQNNPFNNRVYFGDYPCVVKQSTKEQIICQSTASDSAAKYYPVTHYQSRPLRLLVGNQIAELKLNKHFQYNFWSTPIIKNIYPSTIIGETDLMVEGDHKINFLHPDPNNIGYNYKISINDIPCEKKGYNQIFYSQYSFLGCRINDALEAGHYDLNYWSYLGFPHRDINFKTHSFGRRFSYQIVVLPTITKVSPPSGASQMIHISGAGFKNTKEGVKISVDGRDCEIKSIGKKHIQCRVNQTSNFLSKIQTNSSSAQKEGYISGSGWQYIRYQNIYSVNNISNAMNETKNYNHSKIALKTVKGQLKGQNARSFSSNLDIYRGYFKAPKSGQYIFKCLSSGKISLFMSQFYGTAEIQERKDPIIYSDENTGRIAHRIYQKGKIVSEPINLQQQKYYYMELYHLHQYSGFFQIQVEMPNENPDSVRGQVYPIHRFFTKITVQPEIIQFVQEGAENGSIHLKLIRLNSNLQKVYQKSAKVSYNASIDQFLTAIKRFSGFIEYNQYITGRREIFDKSGRNITDYISDTADYSSAYRYVWRVYINYARSEQFLKQMFQTQISEGANFQQTTIRNFSPLIEGDFRIRYNGSYLSYMNSTLFRYDSSAQNIEKALKMIKDFKNVSVTRERDPKYGALWTIFYNQVQYQPPFLQFDFSTLKGGQDGNPSIQIILVQKYSNKLISIVDHRFMYTASSQPAILVTIDGLLSVCKSDCTYKFNKTVPEVSIYYTPGDLIANLTIDNPDIDLQMLNIIEKNSGCKCNIASNSKLPSFFCFLQKNQDGSPKIEAGEIQFEVSLIGFGTLPVSPVHQIRYNMTISSMGPSQGHTDGGYNITIQGRGFYSSNQSNRSIEVKLCEQRSQIMQLTHRKIVFLAPPCNQAGVQNIQIKFGSQIIKRQFTYRQPSKKNELMIDFISPNSINPALKRPLKVFGSGFGNELSKLKVVLFRFDGIKVYLLKPLKVNNTYLEIGFPGSIPGMYKLFVKKIEDGKTILSKTLTEKSNIVKVGVFIYSVQPPSGSPFGGTVLRITGQNFSPDLPDNIVNIGERVNSFCKIISLNQSQILCLTPRALSFLPQKVYLNTKITQDSICMNKTSSCSFIYENITNYLGPKIVNFSKDYYQPLEQVRVTTNNNSDWEPLLQIVTEDMLGIEQSCPFTKISQTQLVFKLPKLQSGIYEVSIKSPKGKSNSLVLKVQMKLIDSSLSIYQRGGFVTIYGQGLPKDKYSKLYQYSYQSNYFHKTISYEIVQCTTQWILIYINPFTFAYPFQTGEFIIEGPVNRVKIPFKFVFQPFIDWKLEYELDSEGNLSFSLFNTSSFSRLRIISTTNQNYYFDFEDFSYGNSVTTWKKKLFPGSYCLLANSEKANFGWIMIKDKINIAMGDIALPVRMMYGLNGAFFKFPHLAEYLSNATVIKVNGQYGKFYEARENHSYFYFPPLLSLVQGEPEDIYYTEQKGNKMYNVIKYLKKHRLDHSFFSDMQKVSRSISQYPFDDDKSLKYESQNKSCYVGINISAPIKFNLKKIYLQLGQKNIQHFRNIIIEVTQDGSEWVQLIKIPKGNIKTKYTFNRQDFLDKPKSQYSNGYKNLRIRDQSGLSKCSVDMISLFGDVESDFTFSDSTYYDMEIYDGFNYEKRQNFISFSNEITPIVEQITPKTGNYLGGYNVTIKGQRLKGFAQVYIDSIPCKVIQNNETVLICRSQERPQNIHQSSFEVIINGSFSIFRTQKFRYVLRWSDHNTWGMSFKPIDGDLIHVPKGQTLLVDQNTPKLAGIVVEGKIIFSDEKPMVITTDFILVNQGQLIAGTIDKPYQNMLTFKLTGNERSKRHPIYGTKVIGCQSCKLSMHGKGFSNFRWSNLNRTIFPNQNRVSIDTSISFKLDQALKGTKIAVTSSSYEAFQTEVLTVKDIKQGQIETDKPFNYKHYTNIMENRKVGSQIGFLGSNVVIEGVDSFQNQKFGAKLIYRGEQNIDNSYFQVSNIEITKCGQPSLYNDHCITVLSNGVSFQSYIQNSSIHDTYSRGIHFSNKLLDFLVQGNFIFNTQGHSLQIENPQSAISIKNNLIANPINSWRITLKDTTPAAIHFFGPMNILQGNHFAGGSHFGLWYDLETHQKQICSWVFQYNKKSNSNYFHSYNKIALYIDKIVSSLTLCQTGLIKQYYETIISSFTFYKNRVGLSIKSSNMLTITNCLFVQNLVHLSLLDSTISFNISKLTKSSFSGSLDLSSNESSALGQIFIQLPCSSFFNISQVYFSNINNKNSKILKSCSLIPLSYTRTDEVFTEKIVYENVSHAQILDINLNNYQQRLYIIYDLDGTFSNLKNSDDIQGNTRRLYKEAPKSTTIVPEFSYLNDSNCFSPTFNNSNLSWSELFVCNSSVKVRKIKFQHNCNSVSIASIQNFTSPMKDASNTIFKLGWWKMEVPLIMDRYYEYSRGSYCEDNQIRVKMISLYREGDGSVIFRQKYQKSKQLFQVKLFVNESQNLQSEPQTNLQIGSPLNLSVCNNGDYFHENSKKTFAFCLSDRNMTLTQQVRIKSIFCKYDCPANDKQQDKCNNTQETNFRVWSNSSMWPNETLPVDGDNVTIQKEWKVILNVNPPKLNFLVIKGTLIIPNDLQQIIIEANVIWVQGILRAGNSTSPFDKNLTIKIGGNFNNPYTIDESERGKSMIVVTGLLSLYGKAPKIVRTKLAQTVLPQSSTIKVVNNEGWSVGDQLVIGPSFRNFNETQYVKITSINNNIIQFEPPLKYRHFGDTSTQIQKGEEIDTRAAIGHLSRNIKIINKGQDRQGLRILTYGYSQCNFPKFGVLKLIGVEVVGGGQNSAKPGIHFKRLTNSTVSSQVDSSSIYLCKSYCISIQSSSNIKFTNNIIASAINMHINVLSKQSKNLKITQNYMIDVRRVGINSKVACFQWRQYKYKSQNISVSNNLCQGSQGVGFSRNYQSCKFSNESIYQKNTVGTSLFGYLLFGQTSCSSVEKLIAFNCYVGVMGNPRSSEIRYKTLIIVDSQIGTSFRSVGRSDNQSVYLYNSYINPIFRQKCANCYDQDVNKCKRMIAIDMFVPTQENSWTPFSHQIYSEKNIINQLSQAAFDGKAFIINSTFANFKYHQGQGYCYQNYLLRNPPSAQQLIGSHHFYNSTCNNCDIQFIINFTLPNKDLVGPLKACGEQQCTGKLNFFIQDHTGHLFSSILNYQNGLTVKGALIPQKNALANYLGQQNKFNNSVSLSNQVKGNNTNQYGGKCYLMDSSKGYLCTNYRFYVLEFQNIGNDYDSRVTWPVTVSDFNLSYWIETYFNYDWSSSTNIDSGIDSQGQPYQIFHPKPLWQTKINTYKEWNFDQLNGTPLSSRINRFNSLILSNRTYNITFRATPPRDLRFQLQNRMAFDQDRGDFVIIRIYYAIPNNIRVEVNNEIIQPITHIQNSFEDPLMNLTHVCGANKYQFKHRVLQLVINNNKKCQPRLTITNSIQLTAKFLMDIDDFFKIDGRNHFIDRMVALLGIDDRSRLKVVGVYRGSTIIETFIEQLRQVIQENQTVTNESKENEDLFELYGKIDYLFTSGKLSEEFKSSGFGELIEFTSNILILKNNQGTQQRDISTDIIQKQDHGKVSISTVLAISLSSFVFILFISLVCVIRKKCLKKVENQILDKSEGKKLQVTEEYFANVQNLEFFQHSIHREPNKSQDSNNSYSQNQPQVQNIKTYQHFPRVLHHHHSKQGSKPEIIGELQIVINRLEGFERSSKQERIFNQNRGQHKQKFKLVIEDL